MDMKEIALIILFVSIPTSIVLYILVKILARRADRNGFSEVFKSYEDLVDSNKPNWKKKFNNFMQDSYHAYFKIPVLRAYVLKIRRRLQAIHSYDEMTMRRETMKIVFSTLGIMTTAILILLLFNQDITFVFMLLLAALIINGMLIDTFIHRVEDRLLIQLRDLNKDIRYHYHQYGMIEEALMEAADATKSEAGLHARKVHEIIKDDSENPEDKLEKYYQSAPNRFLKSLAGLSYLVKEFGDKQVDNGSLYLNNLNKLNEEINLEILKRSKLHYLFSGLTMIAIVPIVFTKPIQLWASNMFPAMQEFYSSKMGFIIQILCFAIVFLSYVLLRKMQDQQEGTYVVVERKRPWEKIALKIPMVDWFVYRLTPSRSTPEHFKISRLLKDANAGYPINWHYLHRLILCLVLSIGMLGSFVAMHFIAINNVMNNPTSNGSLFGKMSEKDLQDSLTLTEFDSQIILQLKEVNKEHLRDHVVQQIKQDENIATDATLINASVERIIEKMNKIDSEYLKWWEILICVLMGSFGYQMPYWILLFQKKMRAMDMQNEVDQFHTIIAMLSEIDRVSVEIILEWMERFSSIFKAPLHTCIINFESGAEQSLEKLKIDAPFVPLVRTVESLLLAVERIPIKQAFDDLESERNYNYEQRKLNYERMIDSKANWGRIIGFSPLYTVIFLYLVIPLIYMSFTQMGVYYDQINKL
ncbi:hypothetical protein [Paenibacillus crassostreae]|uniref:Uncharacterized protein n=1 Tax=Paenibacillus crassostreae TaxID=1763538 RepID=A0A167DSN5_9BACL|nr:hypothetical protein [Paenibacillus crassostreae]AOZ91106.1 hypothetical protein LPB68_02055 [Paenibacillus crassostreae]OAB74734.1 hypothetical protein PNBC_11900 [Paenibacillus crassostreae]